MGFGCLGLTGAYNEPLPEQDGISIIKYAFSKGITFFDTADVYGAGANEILLGKVHILMLACVCVCERERDVGETKPNSTFEHKCCFYN